MSIKNYIDGQLLDPASGNYLENVNPAIGQVYSQVPNSQLDDIDAAVQSAEKAFPKWAGMAASQRAEILRRLADLIDQNRERLVTAESDDNGKPMRLARAVDIPRVSANIRFYAGLSEGFASESHAMPDGINYTLRQPLGVVGVISPWNLPLYLLSWKIAPALAIGNCVVAKPSEVTPMTAYLFSELCIEAGMPPGVLNVVHGGGATTGDAMLTHPGIKAISFTGGTETGEHIARTVAPQFKKFSLELGGKNPNVVFADCDYERTLATSLQAAFANQGQICLCGSRILVQKSLHERFVNDFVSRAKAMKVGDPHEPDSDLGAVVSQPHQQKILQCIETAQQEGGELHCGGSAITVEGRCADGFFIQPTVFTGLSNESQTNQQEIFGPVVTIQSFEDEDQAIALANGTRYGLSSSIWTSDISRGHRMAARINTGVVWINTWMVRDLRTPFGGMKSSGTGREGGQESLRFFTEPKNVFVKY
ncbi:MAG: aldehyde dehydrogenase [Planctomycetaceae bacterium]|nr:aldehyde dehydrogenase [Planctomycetaceae bacterium]